MPHTGRRNFGQIQIMGT